MNVRSFLTVGSLLASMVFPSLAGAQVQVRAGIRIGTPPPPVVVAQPVAPVVVAQPVAPVVVAPSAPPVVYMRRPRRRRVVVVQPPPPVVYVGRHGRRHRHWRHARD